MFNYAVDQEDCWDSQVNFKDLNSKDFNSQWIKLRILRMMEITLLLFFHTQILSNWEVTLLLNIAEVPQWFSEWVVWMPNKQRLIQPKNLLMPTSPQTPSFQTCWRLAIQSKISLPWWVITLSASPTLTRVALMEDGLKTLMSSITLTIRKYFLVTSPNTWKLQMNISLFKTQNSRDSSKCTLKTKTHSLINTQRLTLKSVSKAKKKTFSVNSKTINPD